MDSTWRDTIAKYMFYKHVYLKQIFKTNNILQGTNAKKTFGRLHTGDRIVK